MGSLFPEVFSQTSRKQKLKSVSIRDFGGGWNAVDDDLSMNTRYLPTVRNFHRTPSGAQELRFGTRWFADVAALASADIVDMEYFNGRLIVVCQNGHIVAIDDGDGAATKIWSEDIASALPGAPMGWGSTFTVVDFVPFKNTLILHNGVDKPLSISSTFEVTYLQDLGTGSNVNVPIGKYGCVAANFHIVAGIPATPTELYISSEGTSGTFPGDPDPNNAISLDVGAYAPDGGAEIRGIAGFRTFLLVFFRGQTLVIRLGTLNEDGDHVPEIDDTMPHFGILGHRCFVHHDNDLLFGDTDGMNSARRNLFAGLLDSTHLSDLISPAWQGTLGVLSDEEQLEDAFMVYDRLGNNVLLVEPGGRVFVRSASERLKYQAWSEYGGWNWTCGCTSFLGRVFFAEGTKIFQLGNKAFGELYRADRLMDRDAEWANATPFTLGDLVYDPETDEVYEALQTHVSAVTGTFEEAREADDTLWTLYLGEPIEFEMELPWQDGQDPMRVKQMRYASVVTKGSAKFNLKLYVDNLYKDVDGNVIYQPALTLEMIGNDAGGFGIDPDAFGGGRRSMDPRLWRYSVKFKIAKFVYSGSTRAPLQIIGNSFLFSTGLFKR